MNRVLLIGITLLGLVVLVESAAAQLVVVQPGYVKAPFVRVYTNPDGSSYVRAPFVGVYSPPKYHHRIVPTPEELAELDWWMLRRVVHESAARLDATLSRFPTGDVWRRHFQTRELAGMQASQSEGAPTAEERAKLGELVAIYDAGAASADLRDVARLTDYHVLHGALRELSLPPEPRLRRQLATSARFFNRALDDIRTGESWQRYLALPESVFAGEVAEEDKAALVKLRERFKAVNANETYRGIARLPDFQATRERLARYLELSATSLAKPPTAEELPVPKPQE
jgi:hypothetical protein